MITPFSEKRSVINKTTHKHEDKTEWVTNSEKREEFLSQFGKDRAKGEKRLEELAQLNNKYVNLVPLPFPQNFDWIINHFLKIWRHCETDINGNKVFTTRAVLDYCNCFGVNINYHERRLLFQMKEWAVEAMVELKKEKEREE